MGKILQAAPHPQKAEKGLTVLAEPKWGTAQDVEKLSSPPHPKGEPPGRRPENSRIKKGILSYRT